MKYKGYIIEKYLFGGYVIRDKDGISLKDNATRDGRDTIAEVKKLIDKLVSKSKQVSSNIG